MTAILDSLTPKVKALPWDIPRRRGASPAPLWRSTVQTSRLPRRSATGHFVVKLRQAYPSPSVFVDQQDVKHGQKASPVTNASAEP
jgi:hypothetical protein